MSLSPTQRTLSENASINKGIDTQPNSVLTFFVQPKRFCFVLFWISVAFLAIHVMVYIADQQFLANNPRLSVLLNRLFGLTTEANFPTFFSAGLLFLSSFLLYIIYRFKRTSRDKGRGHWLALSLVFLFLGFDEGIALHDELVHTIRNRLTFDMNGFLYEGWVIPYFLLVAVFGFYFLRFFLRLPPKTKLLFLIAGVTYVGAALGLELFEGRIEKLYGTDNFTFWFLNTIEEFLEMGAIVLFIYALLDYMSPARVKVTSGSETI